MYGNCCNGIRTGGTCSATCHTFFRICLAHYMEKIGSNPDCTYNSHTTPVLGNNTINFTQKDYLPVDYQSPIRLQFSFKWPVSELYCSILDNSELTQVNYIVVY